MSASDVTMAEIRRGIEEGRRSRQVRLAMCPPLSEYDARRRAHYRQQSNRRLLIAGAITDRECMLMFDAIIREDQPLIAAAWDAEAAQEAYHDRIKAETRRRRREASGRGPRRG